MLVHQLIIREEKRNAINPDIIHAFKDSVNTLKLDAPTLILRGAGKIFCAGGDLQWMRSGLTASFEEAKKETALFGSLFQTLYDYPGIVICAVQGRAMGGALGLVCTADFVVAERSAQFCFSEVKLGIAPSIIAPYVLSRANNSVVREWMMNGELFNGEQAQRAQIVSKPCETGALDEATEELVIQLEANGPEAMRSTKELQRYFSKRPGWDDLCDWTYSKNASLRRSEEGQEGMRAFLEKRRPRWIQA